MLNKIIQFSVNNKLIIILMVLGLIGYGSYELTRLPIDAVPDITNNQVQVITVTPSLSAPDVERLITFPIEQTNSNIPGLKEIRSFSRFGLSLVTIVFHDDVDVYWARQQVTERLQQVKDQIPNGIGVPSLAPVTTGLGEIYQYVVRPKPGYEGRFDAMKLRTIQDWIVRRQLLGVEGVADVSSFGGYLKQYEVAVNTSKLASYNMGIQDVFHALEQNNGNTGGAYIEKGPAVLYIRSEGLAGSIADIEQIVIRQTAHGAPILIRDVADVHIGSAVRYGALCYNDEGEVSGAVVMMLKGGNSGQVIKNIKERIAKIQKTLPEGVIIEPFLDRSKMVDNAIGTVEKNLLEGSLIVIFILVLFLGNIRAGLIVASIIPLSMLFAIIMMNLFGVSGNLMSLGALDFGLIVDGAVIIVEAVMHRLSHSRQFRDITRLSQPKLDETVKSSASKMMNSAVFGQIIILIVYLPIFSLQGIEGKMFRPMAQTVAFALLGAFLLSLTYIPMMSALAISKKIRRRPTLSDRIMLKVENGFRSALRRVLDFPKLMITAAASLFAIAVAVLLSLGGEFIPQLEEGDFAVDTRVLTGSSLHTTIDATQKASGILLHRFPEVQKVVAKIGSGEIPTDPMPMEACDMMVILKDKKEWTSAKTFPELAEKMGAALSEVPGITTGFQFPVQMRFNELMTGARQDVVCKVFGENLDSLAHYAEQLGHIAASVKGAKDIYVETVNGLPQIVIIYNRAALAHYGLNIAEINNIVNTAFAGQSTGFVFEEEKRFDLVVRLSDSSRRNATDIRNLMVPLTNGTQIPLNQLANVAIKEGPNQIQRENAQRRIIVGFNVRGRDVQSIVQELQQKAGKIKLAPGYYITYGGAFENLVRARNRLSLVVPLALGLIFLMLFFAFKSVKHALIIYSAIPLSAIGGAFALALRGMPFSISAGVGFIALFGVAVLNGIVLIAEFRRLKAEGLTDLKEIVMQGTRTRLRPVLMTAAVASLGFLPMAISNGAGAEVQRPLATVVIGGLMTATFLTLFLLPVLYLLFEQFNFRVRFKKTMLILLPVLLSLGVRAQSPITLQAAIDSALHHNLRLKSEQMTAAYYRNMSRAGWELDKTGVSAELGHVNSAYTDSKFGITQTIAFPLVYASRRQALQREWRAAAEQVHMAEKELIRQVSVLFCDINILYRKKALLREADSVYGAFRDKAELKYKLGAANVLEMASADNQQGQIRMQLQQLETDLDVLLQQFAWVLHTEQVYVPGAELLEVPPPTVLSFYPEAHPYIAYLEQQRQLSVYNYRVEKARLLPDISFGYYNQSFTGWQTVDGTDRFYTTSDRFSAVQFGLGIPVFFFSHQPRLKALSLNKTIAAIKLEDGKNKLTLQFEEAATRYRQYADAVAYYRRQGLENARLIKEGAMSQFAGGEISYLEYTLLLNQSFSIENEYYTTLKQLDETIFEINYLIKN